MSDQEVKARESLHQFRSRRERFMAQGRRAAAEIASWPAFIRDTISPNQEDIRQLVPKPGRDGRPVPLDARPYSDPLVDE